MTRLNFASDNNAGAHPAVLDAIARVNHGHAPAYGADEHSARAADLLRRELGTDREVFFVFGGTGANVVGLAALLAPHESVICAATAHINVDECGAPERHIGCKLTPVDTPDGKLTPDLVAPFIRGIGSPHHAQPRVISVSQSTEYGTVYTVEEIAALARFAHAHDMYLHIDGARIANAVVSLDTTLKAMVTDTGVDALSFGATKNGALGAEAVVVLQGEYGDRLPYIRKQAMQLASKMRFVAAQVEALLADDLWLSNAEHANRMARRLADGIDGLEGVQLTQRVEANAVFAKLRPSTIEEMQKECDFEVWDAPANEVRLMAAWSTTEEDVDAMIALLKRCS